MTSTGYITETQFLNTPHPEVAGGCGFWGDAVEPVQGFLIHHLPVCVLGRDIYFADADTSSFATLGLTVPVCVGIVK